MKKLLLSICAFILTVFCHAAYNQMWSNCENFPENCPSQFNVSGFVQSYWNAGSGFDKYCRHALYLAPNQVARLNFRVVTRVGGTGLGMHFVAYQDYYTTSSGETLSGVQMLMTYPNPIFFGTVGSGVRYSFSTTADSLNLVVRCKANGTNGNFNLYQYTIESESGIVYARLNACTKSTSAINAQYGLVIFTTSDYGSLNNHNNSISYNISGGRSWESSRVSFNANGGTGVMSDQEFLLNTSQKLQANAFSRSGYKFIGWATSATGSVVYSDCQSIRVSQDMTLYAKWEKSDYVITFSANGGSGSMSKQLVPIGRSANLIANRFSYYGYEFVGWATSSSGAVCYSDLQSVLPTADLTLYAKWKKCSCTITFNPNGGEGEMSQQVILFGNTQQIKSNLFERSGYVFAGWATQPGGAVVYADGGRFTASEEWVTLYAKWTVVDGAFDLVFGYPIGHNWLRPLFLTRTRDTTEHTDTFWVGEKIYCNYFVYNKGEAAIKDGFTILHEVVDARGNVVCSYKAAQTKVYNPLKGYIISNWVWEALNNLPAGSYVYRCTADSEQQIPEKHESNNVNEYAFTLSNMLSVYQILAPDDGASGTVSVLVDRDWTLKTSSDWISVTPVDGKTFDYAIEPNKSTLDRTGVITVTFGEIVNKITVTQKALMPKAYVTDVQVTPRTPWSGIVDVEYTLATEPAGTTATITIQGDDGTPDRMIVAKALSGTGGTGSVVGAGRYRVAWDLSADCPGMRFDNFSVTVVATPRNLFDDPDRVEYAVIDLSLGPSAASYPIGYLAGVPAGGWTDEYKTSKLVLKRIRPGRIMGGTRATDYPDAPASNLHEIVINEDYYIGVFEVTQRQWELVMGTRPSAFSNDLYYATRPVEEMFIDTVRGAGDSIDESSFIGKLRSRCGLNVFDLPTGDAWEYACRAGTVTALNSGKNLTSYRECPNLAALARARGEGYSNDDYEFTFFGGTEVGSASVGSYEKNAWGLYDMHGNVFELCRDGSRRGGSWLSEAERCCSGQDGNSANLDEYLMIIIERTYADNGFSQFKGKSYVGFRLYASKSLFMKQATETQPGRGTSEPISVDMSSFPGAAVNDWLQEILAGKTGTVVLDTATDNPTTVEDLDAARLLGVTPDVSVDGEEITVAVKTTFEVSSLTVANNKVTLVATVTVGKGQALPETITLGGDLKVKVAKNLTDGWQSEPLTFDKPTLTRVDDNTYQMQMEIDLSNHTFYQVIVE